jgi:Flp pilus assembly protein TadD
VVEVEPRDPQAHAELGAAYFATGNYEGASPQFEEALRLKQDSPDALLGLANIHLKKGEENQAIALLQKVVRTAPKEAAPHFLLGTAYNRLGRYQDALAELQSAVRLGADGPDAYYHLARAYGGLGNAEERRAALAKFAELTRKGKEDTEGQRRAGRLVDEAGTMVEAGNLQAAVAALETARELRPSDDRILFRLAGLYYDLMRDAGARSYVEEAISLAPSQWLYHYLLGLIESRSGEKRLARASLETALKLNPNASEVSKALQDLQ